MLQLLVQINKHGTEKPEGWRTDNGLRFMVQPALPVISQLFLQSMNDPGHSYRSHFSDTNTAHTLLETDTEDKSVSAHRVIYMLAI